MNERRERLIPQKDRTTITSVTDLMLRMVREVEDALLQSGATPGEEYTYLDVMTLGAPFAVATFQATNPVDFLEHRF